jgi:hypothetical protein
MSNKKGRNELCPCGSGKKYKKCCGFKAQIQRQIKAEVIGKGPFAALSGASTRGLADRFFKVVKAHDNPAPKPLKVTKGDPKDTAHKAEETQTTESAQPAN